VRSGERQDRNPGCGHRLHQRQRRQPQRATYISQPAVPAPNAASQRRSPSSSLADRNGRRGDSGGNAAAASCSSE